MLCTSGSGPLVWTAEQSSMLFDYISHEYFIHLIVDNLPCATQFSMPSTDDPTVMDVQYEPGFRLGVEKDSKMYVNNHLKFIMSYHKTGVAGEDGKANYRVVGFRVETGSVDHQQYEVSDDGTCTIKDDTVHQEVKNKQENK